MTNQPNPASDILKRIHAGGVRMRPRIYFILRALAAFVLAGIILLITGLIGSFVLFALHATGQEFLLGFGAHGLFAFFALFPWFLLALDFALIALLEWLLRQITASYRFSIATFFFWLFVASSALAVLINATPLHPRLQDRADHGALPVAGSFYEDLRQPHHDIGVFRGVVQSIGSSTFSMTHDDHDSDTDDRIFFVQFSGTGLAPGDHVFVFGHPTASGTIEAEHIQKFED